MHVVYIGNVGPESAPHSTENHITRALEANGHMVSRVHEQRYRWDPRQVTGADLVLWTHTHGFAPRKTYAAQSRWLEAMRRQGVPVVGAHLDRWWDLQREHLIHEEPYFRVDLLATADGGNDERWAAAGVNHTWFPPGVSAHECELGRFRPELASDIAFVGSHAGGYHPESNHRVQLVDWLRQTFGDRCRFWPALGEPAVRGEQLRDLYASVKVLVGDSCLVGTGRNDRYISDRVPESLGRGGLLVHPDVTGVTDGTLYTSGEHLLTWPAGDWKALRQTIAEALASEGLRERVSAVGKAHVLANHTYEVRMRDLLVELSSRGLIKQGAAA